MLTRLRYALAAATLALAVLPASGGCVTNLAGGCPVFDDGKDDCQGGDIECVDETTLRKCINPEGCKNHWLEEQCPMGQRCTVKDSIPDCR